MVLCAMGGASAAVVTEFSDDFSGYPDGTQINTTTDWGGSGDYRAEWTVNSGRLYTSTSGYSKVYMRDTLNSGAAGYRVSARFSMDIASGMTASYADIMRIDLVAQENIHQNDAGIFIRRDSDTQFRLIYRVEDHDTVLPTTSLGTFFLGSMGVDGSGSTDELWMGFDLMQTSETGWQLTGTVSNLTQNTLIVSDTVTFDASAAFLDNNDLSGMLYVTASDTDGSVSNRAFDDFIMETIPEPATMGLFSVAGAVCMFLSHRRGK
jgi:hypothetical protein